MPRIHHNVELADTKQSGQTGIYRNTNNLNKLMVSYNDNIHTLYDIWKSVIPKVGKLDCLGHRAVLNPLTDERGTEYVWQSYEQVAKRADLFGSGLRQLVEDVTGKTAHQQSPIGIWAINRPEWTLTDIACVSFGFYSVSLYDTLGDDTVKFVINHSELEVVVCSANHLGHLLEIQSDCPTLKLLISMDPLTDYNNGKALVAWAKEKGVALYDFQSVEQLGSQHPLRPHVPPQPSDLALILYTSGTTGNPKGAMLTHTNIIASVSAADSAFDYEFGKETILSYLPLPHIFGRTMDWGILAHGGRIGYFSGSVDLLLQDIQILKPTLFPSVPRLLNRIYAKLAQATVNAPGTTGRLFRLAVNSKINKLRQQQGYTHPVWDRLLFSKVKQALGGNIKVMVTGSAPIAGEVMEFLKVALCVEIVEAYGCTENAGCATNSQRNEYRTIHVGAACPCTELKLIDVPEMNYLSTDPQPRGEICTRGISTFLGYYKDEEKTREALIDGWLHTGDIGMIDKNGNLVIIDRKKNIFKLAQGEFIAPEKIENVLTNDPLVMQVFVYGDSLQSELVAIVVPEPEELEALASKLHIKAHSLEDLCRHSKLIEKVLHHLTLVTKQAKLKGFEQPKAIHLEPVPFSIESGILTPTMKLKRPEAKQLYQQEIEALYQQLASKSPKAFL